MGAMLDELACLARDFLILKTAPQEGISMLSGVASDEDVKALSKQFSAGELARMLNIIQKTAAGFTRSASRRMDAELCVLNLCLPELKLDPDALNSRITRIEDMLKSGTIQMAPSGFQPDPGNPITDEDLPPMPDDRDAPPVPDEDTPVADEAPIGFWTDLVAQVRKELKPPVSGFFVTSPNAPLQGVLVGSQLKIICVNTFAMEMVNKKEVLNLIAMKASAKLGRPIQVILTDQNKVAAQSEQMEELLQFGRDHSDIIKINDNE